MKTAALIVGLLLAMTPSAKSEMAIQIQGVVLQVVDNEHVLFNRAGDHFASENPVVLKLKNGTADIVDNQKLELFVYREGTFRYVSVLGAVRSVRLYVED